MTKQIDIIDYKDLAEDLITYLCDVEGITETIIILLEKGQTVEDLYSVFSKEEVDEAVEEYEKRTKEV